MLRNYTANLYSAYGDAVNDANAFDAQIATFLGAPSEDALTAARKGWLDSRAHYVLTEGARFYGGPIDVSPPDHESQLNSWPLDEAYIDYTTNKATNVVDETSGLVNQVASMPSITIDALDAVNGKDGDNNISNGYHALEFLLWGQALVDVGPGTRPATDYVIGGARKNPDRRGTYLRVASQGVIQHLSAVRDAWAPTADYRTKFEANGLASVALALTGMARFSKGELAGQRMGAPYASKSRRDQHDCFSSQTLVDYLRDAQGVQAMYLGNYGANDGPGFDELVRAADAGLDTRLRAQLQTSVDAISAIPAPFEAAIVGDDSAPGRVAIQAAMTSLRAQADLFAEAAAALGQTIEVPDDN